jgi:sRNA-binding protein
MANKSDQFFTFVDYASMKVKHPKEINIPSIEDFNALNAGDEIRVSNGVNRFWLIVKECLKDSIIAQIDTPIHNDKYAQSDLIQVRYHNVCQINKTDN